MAALLPGTFARYQGFPLVRCTFQRSRGWSSTSTTVEVLASIATPFTVASPDPPKLFTVERDPDAGNLSARGILGNAFKASGYLTMSEVVNGEEFTVTVGPLYVVRAEEVRKPDGSSVGRIRLSLEDARYFWVRGVLPRWSFNRSRADKSIALDSVKPDGSAFTKLEVATLAAAALPGKPVLDSRTTPPLWAKDTSPQEFPRFGLAMRALAALSAPSGLEDPCLRLSGGTVSIPAAGAGKLGWARDGVGANTEEFPPGVVLYKDGQARGRVVEPGFPDEFVIVVGSERIATVAVDDWEPVLLLPGDRVVPLSEETVRKLTDGAFGLDWLKRFVLAPTAYQGNPRLDDSIADLFADQAWRVYRLPGAVIQIDGLDAAGPNAHLLPIQPRAETQSGRRMAPTVEAFTFTTEHVRLKATPGDEALSAVNGEIAKLADSAKKKPEITIGEEVRFTGSVIGNLKAFAAVRAVSLDEIDAAIAQARVLDSYESKSVSQALIDLSRKKADAEDTIGVTPGRRALLEIGLAVIESEKAFKAEAPNTEDAYAFMAALVSRLQPFLVQIERERAEKLKQVNATGLSDAGEAFGLVVLSNRPKQPRGLPPRPRVADPDARVIDPQAGLVRLSSLGGHVDNDGAVDASSCAFVPRPVRVLFGAALRPRVDVPPGGSLPGPRELTGGEFSGGPVGGEQFGEFGPSGRAPPDILGGQNEIAAVLSDQEAYYTAAFRRASRGVPVPVPLSEVAFDRATPVSMPDLVELVRLGGGSNSSELDARAFNSVAERMNVPDSVETTRLLLARPWPVQCDGVVSSVTITMREKDGAPCGFETLVTTGSTAAAPRSERGETTVRPSGGGGGAARREGVTT